MKGMSNTGFNEKIDALDLMITALKDHEKRLDALSQSLTKLLSRRVLEKKKIVKEEERRQVPAVKKVPLVIFNNWNEFKTICQGARVVSLEITDASFDVYSMLDDVVYKYAEQLPKKSLRILEESTFFSIDKASLENLDFLHFLITSRLKCGLDIRITSSKTRVLENQFLFKFSYDINLDEAKAFLSRELEISKKDIVEGKIIYQTSA